MTCVDLKFLNVFYVEDEVKVNISILPGKNLLPLATSVPFPKEKQDALHSES